MDMTNFNGDEFPSDKSRNISGFIPPLDIVISDIGRFHQYLVISLEDAVRLAVEYFRENEFPLDMSCLNTLIRYHTRRNMKQKADLELFDDFGVDEKLTNIGLSADFNGYHIRIFKDRSDHLLIPNSYTKESFFCQQLRFNMGPSLPVSLVNDRPNIMFLWNLDNSYSLIPLRLVCPKSGVIHKNFTQVYHDILLTEFHDYKGGTVSNEEPVIDLDITKKDIEVENKSENKDNNEGNEL